VSQTPPTDDEQHQIHIGEVQARGARRVGLIWMLVASLAAMVIVMAVVLAYFAGSLAQANRHGGPGAIPKADAAQFHTPS
jgi:predicted membrane-bound mannosyltransferase